MASYLIDQDYCVSKNKFVFPILQFFLKRNFVLFSKSYVNDINFEHHSVVALCGVKMKEQSHNRVKDMLDQLPEDQREVIILRHYADMSFKEIASVTNCSINTALGRMRYGLINLRKMMVQKQIAL